MQNLRLLSWRIGGMQRRLRLLNRLLEILEPDFVCLQDIADPAHSNTTTQNTNQTSNAKRMMHEFGFRLVVTLSPVSVKQDSGIRHGNVLVASLRQQATPLLISLENHGGAHAALIAPLSTCTVIVHSVLAPAWTTHHHSSPLAGHEETQRWRTCLADLSGEIRSLPSHAQQKILHVIAGGLGISPDDSNRPAQPQPHAIAKKSKQESQRQESLNRFIHDLDLVDSSQLFSPEEGQESTWHSPLTAGFDNPDHRRIWLNHQPSAHLNQVWVSRQFAPLITSTSIISEILLTERPGPNLPLLIEWQLNPSE